MKKGIFLALIAGAMVGCVKVPAGNVGVKVNLLGTSKGVEVETKGVGRYWVGINEEYYLFPTYTQNQVWSKASRTSDDGDESISFQSVEGMTVSVDVGISYNIRADKAADIFQKYRKGVDEITSIYLRNMVRDAFVKVASERKIESIYGNGKTELVQKVEDMVRNQVDGIGINVEKVYIVGSPRLPGSVINAINAKINATQITIQRTNEIEQVKAEAQKLREEAKGIADSQREKADAQAYSVEKMAEAEAKAIRLKGETIKQYPEVIKLSQIEKWDGTLPKFTGDAVPMIHLEQ